MDQEKIAALEFEIYEKVQTLNQLKKQAKGIEVKDYSFDTMYGKTSLSELFADKNVLLAIHNMGQGCRYCTLWADGINAFLPHLNSKFAVAMLSKDSPQVQQTMANDRAWRFTWASHAGGNYIQEQTVMAGEKNYPGIVCYEKKDGKIYRKNSAIFGPNDLYCSLWHIIALAGEDAASFTPQFHYWQRPQKMDDGGENLNDA